MEGLKISELYEITDPNDNNDFIPIYSVARNSTVKLRPRDFLRPIEYDNGQVTDSLTIDPTNGRVQKVTLTGGYTCTLSFAQPASGTSNIILKVIQDSLDPSGDISGGLWPAGTVPTITGVAGAVDIISIFLDGTNAYCMIAQDFS